MLHQIEEAVERLIAGSREERVVMAAKPSQETASRLGRRTINVGLRIEPFTSEGGNALTVVVYWVDTDGETGTLQRCTRYITDTLPHRLHKLLLDSAKDAIRAHRNKTRRARRAKAKYDQAAPPRRPGDRDPSARSGPPLG